MTRRDRLWTQLWIAPVVGAVVALVLGSLVLVADHLVDWSSAPALVYRGTADSARTFMSVTVTAVTTLLALVFTIIAVVIQLASGQYTPRILGTLVKDRPTHLTIGIFVGTITYGLLSLQALDGTRDTGQAEFSSMTVTIGFVITVVAIGTFAAYSNHIVHAVRVERIVGLGSDVALGLLEELHPDHIRDHPSIAPAAPPSTGEPDQVVRADRPGVLQGFDSEALVGVARRAGSVVVLVPRVGSFVRTDGALLEVHGPTVADDELRAHLQLGRERSAAQDLPFAVRELVDIATRSLSPGDHDPTTAVQVLDQLHELLALMATRDLGDGIHIDEDGEVRLLVEADSWPMYLELAVTEVRQLGSGSPQVTRRLLDLLEDVRDVAPPGRREAVEEQRQLVLAAVEESHGGHDRRRAATADRQGLAM